jgi:hypothetical protein
MIRLALIGLVLIFAATGCMTKAQARRQAREAFLAGRNSALAEQAAQGIKVIGPVQKSAVPWVAGLTLTQALATANYIGIEEPQAIILTRRGESADIDPNTLSNGAVIPLEPGDVVEIR